MDRRLLVKLTITIGIATAGGALATLAGLPASWLSGSMAAVTVITIAGFDSQLPVRVIDVAFLLLGTALGAGVTPELLANAAAWPVSLAILAVTVIVGIAAVRAFLVRIAGWDRETAFFASIPGALSYVLAIASETNADMRKVATAQSIRVFLLVAALPGLLVALEGGGDMTAAASVASPIEIAIMLLAALVSAVVARRLRLPAAFMFGGFFSSAVLQGTGLVVGRLPELVVTVSFIFLGALIGSRFVGTTLRFLRQVLLASVGAFLVVSAIAFTAALLVAAITGVSIDQAIVAFAPGGLEAMLSLALALDLDSTFVAAHQFARFAGLALLLPFVTHWAIGRGSAEDQR
ncbi:AbrB family transcriptional regulator [Bauldia sp.]|uniref:AbrB family transcriptional regulator n=1 Tax=Bauldia sp. TaxID=2575872 RepID=UPI003BACD9E6